MEAVTKNKPCQTTEMRENRFTTLCFARPPVTENQTGGYWRVDVKNTENSRAIKPINLCILAGPDVVRVENQISINELRTNIQICVTLMQKHSFN